MCKMKSILHIHSFSFVWLFFEKKVIVSSVLPYFLYIFHQ